MEKAAKNLERGDLIYFCNCSATVTQILVDKDSGLYYIKVTKDNGEKKVLMDI